MQNQTQSIVKSERTHRRRLKRAIHKPGAADSRLNRATQPGKAPQGAKDRGQMAAGARRKRRKRVGKRTDDELEGIGGKAERLADARQDQERLHEATRRSEQGPRPRTFIPKVRELRVWRWPGRAPDLDAEEPLPAAVLRAVNSKLKVR